MWFIMVQILTVLVLLLPLIFAAKTRRWYGDWFGDLVSNNNARASLLIKVAALLLVEAIIASTISGLPESPLVSGSQEVYQETSQYVTESQVAKSGVTERLRELFSGGVALADKPAYTAAQSGTKSATTQPVTNHSSWSWWLSAIIVSLAALVYWPLSRRDELIATWKRWGRAIARRRQTATGSAVSGTAPAATAAAATASSSKSVLGKWGKLSWLVEWLADDMISDVFTNLFKRK